MPFHREPPSRLPSRKSAASRDAFPSRTSLETALAKKRQRRDASPSRTILETALAKKRREPRCLSIANLPRDCPREKAPRAAMPFHREPPSRLPSRKSAASRDAFPSRTSLETALAKKRREARCLSIANLPRDCPREKAPRGAMPLHREPPSRLPSRKSAARRDVSQTHCGAKRSCGTAPHPSSLEASRGAATPRNRR